jgi:hypothetical protein
MDNFYQIDFLSRMTSVHPAPIPTVTPILAAVSADGFYISGTEDNNIRHKELEMSILMLNFQNIPNSNRFNNKKKEVTNNKANIKHCKTIQCNTYWTQA